MTNGSADDHERELSEVLSKLEKAGDRASEKKTEMFKKELTWLGYHINQNGVKPIKDKTEAIPKLAAQKNVKELKSFLGSTQYLSKLVKNLSKKLDRMRKLLKKDSKWEWTTEINDDFGKLEKEITEAPYLARFDPNKDSYVTTDVILVWEPHYGRKKGEVFRLNTFASRFLTDCEKQYAINELELLRAL